MDAHWDFAKALRRERAARVPFWEVWFAMDECGRRLVGLDPYTPEGKIALAERLGWDVVPASGPGLELGALSTSRPASDGTLHYVQGTLTSLAQLPTTLPDPRPALDHLRRLCALAHPHGIAVCLYLPWAFHSINTLMGLQHFAYALYDDRPFVEAAFDWVEERTRWMIEEVVLPGQPDLVLFDGDCAFKNGLMVRPSLLRELVFERTRQTVAPLRAAGIPYVLHSDGKADDLLPVLIELGFSAFHGVEAACNDLGDIVQRFGDRLCLMGNMDVVFLTQATPEQVRERTRAMLEVGSAKGGYVAACNTSPLDYIPDANYLAFSDTIREFRVPEAGPAQRRAIL